MANKRNQARRRRTRRSFLARIRGYFFAGVLVTAPIGITLYLSWLMIDIIDNQVMPLIPARYNPETYLPFSIPGLGLIIAGVVLVLIGWLAAGLMGRWIFRFFENVMAGMPVVRNIYSAIKQILETVLAQQSNAFRQVVLIEYPRRGLWVLGFLTGETGGEVQSLIDVDMVNVFVPTTPNPTSGFLLFVPRQDVQLLEMTVEDGIKLVISTGIVKPLDRRTPQLRAKPPVLGADKEDDLLDEEEDFVDEASPEPKREAGE